MNIYDWIRCPICGSVSPESRERLLRNARVGLARFLWIARRARVNVTIEQQRDILETLVIWENTLYPGPIDWLVHEHAQRAVTCAVDGHGLEPLMYAVMASMPPWNANAYDVKIWDCAEEQRVADQLAPLLKVGD